MRKALFGAIGLAVLLGGLFAVVGTNEAAAEVSVNINIGPPPIVVAEPPEIVLVPRTQVYFVPHQDIDVFFYGGFWWSPRGDRWYRAKAYNGPWGIVERRHVPVYVSRVPKDYRSRYGKERRIPYGQWKKGPKHRQKEVRKEVKEHRKDRREHEREDRGGRGHGR